MTSPYEYSNERGDDVITSHFLMYILYEYLKIVNFPLIRMVKTCPQIKIYQSKSYFLLILGGDKASFIFSQLNYEIFVISAYEINRKL